MACAEAVQQDNLKIADALVKHIGLLASSQAGAMRKVTYFAEALARRIYRIYPEDSFDSYLIFFRCTSMRAVRTSNSLISQQTKRFSKLSLQQRESTSSISTSNKPDNTDALQQVGLKLAQLAETIGVEFEFRGFVANSLADIEPGMLEIRPANVEAVAVNSVFELHRLLARALSKGSSSLSPSTTTTGLSSPSEDLIMSEVYLGRQICNVVACEGSERVERHETLAQWRNRMSSAGFDPVHLGSNASKLVCYWLCSQVEMGTEWKRTGGLMLGWHTRPLIATSAWQLSESTQID
ncbi:hypothetical protein FNV43_RR13292 [Rhamnella rubrinervis]|uniref:DELLA protein n=1 Tax=Rhamnella rubrinervis TaxID=2594499 RepID=A0A8K0H0V7_9ROSA|nr:hypothetical protein FNV43_RR13292 [Rhamnella rubrinervis]